MVFGAAKTLKWWCSGADFSVICENYMLWSVYLGLKMGVLKWHIPKMHIVVYGSGPPGVLPTRYVLTDWEESHVSDAKVPKFRLARSLRSLAIIYVFFSSFWFSLRNKSSWTRPYHGHNQGHNLLSRQTMWFINRILRRIVCFRPKNTTNFGSLAISIAFSWVSGLLVDIKKHLYIYTHKFITRTSIPPPM